MCSSGGQTSLWPAVQTYVRNVLNRMIWDVFAPPGRPEGLRRTSEPLASRPNVRQTFRRSSNKPKRTPPGCAKRSEAQMCQNADPRGVQNASLERLWVAMRTGQENRTNETETDTSHERFGLPPNRKNLALAQNATLRCMQNTKSQIAYPTGV